MALMDCPECNELISEHAEACPMCGFPMKTHLEKQGHFETQNHELEESSRKVLPPIQKSEKKLEHQEAGCLFSILSFGFFIIWLSITLKAPHKMTYFSIALCFCSGFYLKKPDFFSKNPDPRHKSMSFIFMIYFIISSLCGVGLLYFNLSIPLPF